MAKKSAMRHKPFGTRSIPKSLHLRDGHAPVQVTSRFGRLAFQRQIFALVGDQPHGMPGNAALPPQQGLIMTRGLQELDCLLPQDLPLAPVAYLLGWYTQEAAVRSATTIRICVRTHGRSSRTAWQTGPPIGAAHAAAAARRVACGPERGR